MSTVSTVRRFPITINKFYTESDRAWQDPAQEDILGTQPFTPPYRYMPPQVVIGLSQIDLGPGELAIGVKSSAEEISMTTFQPRVSIWGDGVMTATTCTWLATAGNNQNFQSGVCRTTRNSPKTFDIRFRVAFEKLPRVVVFISGFQLSEAGQWDVGGYAKEVSTAGFTLVVEEGDGAELYQSEFSWIAFMESDEICGGRVGGIHIGSPNGNTGYRSWDGDRKISFPSKFTKKPNVAQWVSRIRTNHTAGLGMRVRFPYKAVNGTEIILTENSLTFNVETWHHTQIKELEMSWVAVAMP